MTLPASPIVVLDSGLGGLTVVRAIRSKLPGEHILYFGDTARVPYGSKSPATVTRFVQEIIAYLQDYHPKHVVVACNTATAVALSAIRKTFPHLNITGVIEPGARAAVEATAAGIRSPNIALIATEATVRSGAYERAILALRPDAKLTAKATPLLVPIIEEGRHLDDPVLELALRQYLAPIVATNPDALVLGCTHYPILKNLIRTMVPRACGVIDSADGCAEDVAVRLEAAGLVSGGSAADASATAPGSLRCFVTDDSPKFALLAERFLGLKLQSPPTWVSPEALYERATTTPTQDPVSLRPAV